MRSERAILHPTPSNMRSPPFEGVMWVRHDHDEGLAWPGIFLCAVECGGMVMSALHHRRGPTAHPLAKSSSSGNVPLFFLPYSDNVVAPTQWCPYDQRPQMDAGITQKSVDMLKAAEVQMNAIRAAHGAGCSDLSDAPATPATIFGSACAGTCSAVTPASLSLSDDVSPKWYLSSGGKTSQPSPVSSASSTSTELELPLTQLLPDTDGGLWRSRPGSVAVTPGHQADVEVPNSLAAQSSSPQKREAVGVPIEASSVGRQRRSHSSEEESEEHEVDSTPFPNCRGKRQRSATSSGLEEENGGGDVVRARRSEIAARQLCSPEVTAAPNSPRRKKECLERNQFPRLQSPLVNVGSMSYHHQRSNDNATDLEREWTETSDTSNGWVEKTRGERFTKQVVAGFSQENGKLSSSDDISKTRGSCEIDAQEQAEEERKLNGRAGGERRNMLQMQAHTCPTNASGCSGWQGVYTRVLSRQTSAASAGCGHEMEPAATIQNTDESKESGRASKGGAQGVEGQIDEAVLLRGAGVTGHEEFKDLFSKLRSQCKWRWGPPVNRLGIGSDYWIVKPGVSVKAARVGVEKFRSKADVVRYVQEVLGVEDGVLSQSEAEENESENEDSEGYRGEEQELDKGRLSLSPEVQDLQRALEELRPSNAPNKLTQRAGEFEQVLEFISSGVKESRGGSMYLCGCPGTGKTQTMAHVQGAVQTAAKKDNFPSPEFHAFTGTAFTEPNAMHDALWRAVAGQGGLPSNVEKALSRKLTPKKLNSSAPMIVVVLDEIDQLMSQNREVLRKLFEWADSPKSRLLLVGIANSIEFDIGFSHLRRTPVKVLFAAYTPQDLRSILAERVGLVMEPGAINLCAKKIASTHGDARRAINLCREAVTVAKRELQAKLDTATLGESKGGNAKLPVTIGHMAKAWRAARGCQYEDAIAALSLQAQIVLCVAATWATSESDYGEDLCDCARPQKRARLTQGGLHEKCMTVWEKSRTGGLSQIEFSGTVDMLAAQGLLGVKGKQHAGGRARQLVLQIEFSDVQVALGDQPFFKVATGR